MSARLALPQPFTDLDHTADVGAAVEGATAEEALARLVLAQSALLAGGAEVAPGAEVAVAVELAPGSGLPEVAVALLRELLFRFATERVLPRACEVLRVDDARAEARVELGPWDPERHGDGLDLKAVTWHAAALERRGDRWAAQVVWDI